MGIIQLMQPPDEQSRKQIVVVNSSHPELDQLAGELAIRGRLRRYVGRYFPSGRAWERMLASLPVTRSVYLSGPGRRKLPAGLNAAERTQAGTWLDFASGMPRRLVGQRGEAAYRAFQASRDKAIIRAGLRAGRPDEAVFANFSMAQELFHRAAGSGALRLLNYPIAHHTYTRILLEEEARLHPEFALDLLGQTPQGDLAARLDLECELASSILVGSFFVKESFISSGVAAEKLYVASYGVNVQDFVVEREASARKTFRAAWVGQVSQRKGIKYLLEGWKQFAGSETELAIAGHFMAPTAAFKAYENLYRPLGFLDNAGLRGLFGESDVLVLPSLIEGMALVVLQAMAAGLPVIVTTHAAGDVVRDGIDGFHVPIRSSDAIAEKLTLLRDNPELRLEMGRNAMLRAQEFTWQRFRDQAASYVESMLDG